MEVNRLIDLSIYYYVSNLFSSVSYITIVDGYPETELELPVVAIDFEEIATMPGELGNKKRIQNRFWTLDIYAKTKAQRDEIGFRILDALENNLPVYNYNEGFPPDVTPTQLGVLVPEILSMDVIKINPEFTEKLYYRATVVYRAIYSNVLNN